jgi:hypothetical protein
MKEEAEQKTEKKNWRKENARGQTRRKGND